MFCTNCGAHIEDGAKFCVNCGTPVAGPEQEVKEKDFEETVAASEEVKEDWTQETPAYTFEPEHEEQQAPADKKVWQIFAKVGFALGLVSFIAAFIPYLNYVGVEAAVAGIILSSLGKKSTIFRRKAKSGVTFSILGLVLGFVFAILYAIVLGVSLYA